ncbi:hypothetical protein [Deinococcus hopiensis]|uniref:Uncharacterized protein n=1 Tax=Deinococcus hopiensis KR-140 TaxID=695939 RepID=A0A1W1UJK1_9DEIO|nr:hypothetical protein [Deinococcus hopiensis]SMB81260.1 hypothetical protein SAMN00790413_04514 [Deinococcus hopiensis KR-140]
MIGDRLPLDLQGPLPSEPLGATVSAWVGREITQPQALDLLRSLQFAASGGALYNLVDGMYDWELLDDADPEVHAGVTRWDSGLANRIDVVKLPRRRSALHLMLCGELTHPAVAHPGRDIAAQDFHRLLALPAR